MELFDLHELADARHRDALRSFRFAERAGLTREGKTPARGRRWSFQRDSRPYANPERSANLEA
ncbi:MAG: hypothetical protein U0837_08390 [Dehalococcoidia bacterium]|jgi:hypothetical protein